jgi:outer membrane protein TolC
VLEARAQLAAVLQVDEPIELTEDPAAHAPVAPPLGAALADGEAYRPELAGARAQVHAQVEATRAARSGYWPMLQLFAHADLQNSNPFIQGLSQDDLSANFYGGAQLQWTFFDTLSTWAQVRDAEYQRARLQADETRLRFTIEADVRSAHAELVKAIAQRAPTQRALDVARETVDLLRARYRAGDALVIELLDAEMQLLRSESDLVDNAIAIARAEAELAGAQGKL